jgi:hypothetical protein
MMVVGWWLDVSFHFACRTGSATWFLEYYLDKLDDY